MAALAALLLLWGRASPLPAQDSPADAPGPGVYLVTFGPGEAVWEKFGHNGIWIVDPELGLDRIYDWGRFSFGDGFVTRFVQGYLRYWMGSAPSWQYFDAYREADRSIHVQELDVSADARRELAADLAALDTDRNRFYEYNYFLDNCSTRVRDVVDGLTGGVLAAVLGSEPARGDFRFHTQRLTASSPLLNAGLLLAIGPRADAPASKWEEAFIPMALRDHVRGAVLAGPAGAERPLVARDWTVYESTLDAPPQTPPSRLLPMLAIGVALAALIVVLGSRARHGGRRARRALAATVGLWSLVAGALGVLILGLWVGTEHVFTYGNENVLQMTPLSLALAALGPLAVLRGRAAAAAAGIAFVVAGLSLAGFLLQALPALDQTNAPIIALCLPAHLATVWALRGREAYGWTAPSEER